MKAKENTQLAKDLKKMWPLLLGDIFYYVVKGMAEAVLWKEIYEVVDVRLISLQSALGWGIGLVLGMAWIKWGKKLLRLLIPLHAIQIVFYIIYFVYNEATLNIFMFWLIGFMNYIFLGAVADKVYLCASYWFFKDSKERSSFENFEDMAQCLSACVGSLIAVVYVPPLRVAMFCDFISMFVWCVLVLYFSIPRRQVLYEVDPEEPEKIAEGGAEGAEAEGASHDVVPASDSSAPSDSSDSKQ